MHLDTLAAVVDVVGTGRWMDGWSDRSIDCRPSLLCQSPWRGREKAVVSILTVLALELACRERERDSQPAS